MPRKRLVLIALILTMLASAVVANVAFACDITLSSAANTGTVGQQVSVLVSVKLTHKNCITPIEQTAISASGATIVSSTPWKQTSSDTFQKTVVLRLDRAGGSTLTVVRECSKGGDTAKITIETSEGIPTVTVTSTAMPASASATATSATSESTSQGQEISLTLAHEGSTGGGTGDQGPGAGLSPAESGYANKASTGGSSDDLLAIAFDPRVLGMVSLTLVAAYGLASGRRRLRTATMIASVAYLGFYLGGCLCPLGSLQKLFLGPDAWSQRLLGLTVLAIPIVTALFAGRLFCGWVCPSGALQELVHRPGSAWKVPAGLDRVLKQLKYLVLAGLIVTVVWTGETVFEGIDPFKAAFNLDGPLPLLVALAVLLALSAFVHRPFCRYLCPMGALLGIVSRVSLFRWQAASSCVSCKACAKACAVQALSCGKPGSGVAAVEESECLSCGECRGACRKSAVGWRLRLAGLRLRLAGLRWPRRTSAESPTA